jgi:hypothetical protein
MATGSTGGYGVDIDYHVDGCEILCEALHIANVAQPLLKISNPTNAYKLVLVTTN